MKQLFSILLLAFAFSAASAADLQTAKDNGLVGEAQNGYLAAVKTPASDDIKRLMREVNGKRKARFEQTASRTGATLEQVQFRFYELAVQKTRPGHYYQDQSGRWVKKK